MSISATYHCKCDVTETQSQGIDVAANPDVLYQFGAQTTLTASSSAPVTKVYGEECTLTGATYTIDLDVLDAPHSTTQSFNGLKVQLIHILANAANNAGGLEFKEAAAEGYFLFGTTGDKQTLFPGSEYQAKHTDTLPAVSSNVADKITVTGTAGDKFKIILVAG